MILVGTLYRGEGGLTECQLSLDAQDIQFARVVLSGLDKHEAHRQLFAFFKASLIYSHLVKVDADTELDPGAVRFLLDQAGKYPEDGEVGARLHDRFSNQPVYGVMLYSQKANWQWDVMMRHTHPSRCLLESVRRRRLRKVLGHHGRHASPRQAFYAGWHRQVRLIATNQSRNDWTLHVLRRSDEMPGDLVLRSCAAGIRAAKSREHPLTTSNGPAIDELFKQYVVHGGKQCGS